MLTIFTPTYNRAHTIYRTYNSLLRQSCFDFEWLIVDDGSTDSTESIVNKWIDDSLITIRYIKQPNGGKYRAYNNGLKHAKGDLFFCVDSDDWLPTNAVEVILSYRKQLIDNVKLAGVIALKMYSDQKIIGKPFKSAGRTMSLYDLERTGEGGERSLLFKTDIARLYPFPESTSEKFTTESVVYDRYHTRYEFLVSNDTLTICEYQLDGLSSNPKLLMKRNPAGYKLYYAQRINMAQSIIERVRYIIRYHAFSHIYGGNEYDYVGSHKSLVKLLSPLGFLAKYVYSRVK